MRVQAHKKFLIYGIGLTAILFTLAALTLPFAHFAIPAAILIYLVISSSVLSSVLAIIRVILDKILLDSKGWEFEIENLLPESLRSKTIKKIYKEREVTRILTAKKNKKKKDLEHFPKPFIRPLGSMLHESSLTSLSPFPYRGSDIYRFSDLS
jgi:hypothetical protein